MNDDLMYINVLFGCIVDDICQKKQTKNPQKLINK